MPLLALLLIAAPAQPAAAPLPAETFPTARGTAGVSFFLPGGGDSKLIGATWFLADDMAVRGDASLSLPLSPSGPGQVNLFSLSLGLRLYQLKRNHVAIFLQPAAALGRENSPAVTANAAWFIRFGGGVGVEYFFTNWFSAGAVLELSLKLANLAGPANTSIFTTVGTDTSSLSANFYF